MLTDSGIWKPTGSFPPSSMCLSKFFLLHRIVPFAVNSSALDARAGLKWAAQYLSPIPCCLLMRGMNSKGSLKGERRSQTSTRHDFGQKQRLLVDVNLLSLAMCNAHAVGSEKQCRPCFQKWAPIAVFTKWPAVLKCQSLKQTFEA